MFLKCIFLVTYFLSPQLKLRFSWSPNLSEHFHRRTSACTETPVTRGCDDMRVPLQVIRKLVDRNTGGHHHSRWALTPNTVRRFAHISFTPNSREDDFSQYSGIEKASPKPQRALNPLGPSLWLGLRPNNSEHAWRLWGIQAVWPERRPWKGGSGRGWKRRNTKSPINHLAVQSRPVV